MAVHRRQLHDVVEALVELTAVVRHGSVPRRRLCPRSHLPLGASTGHHRRDGLAWCGQGTAACHNVPPIVLLLFLIIIIFIIFLTLAR